LFFLEIYLKLAFKYLVRKLSDQNYMQNEKESGLKSMNARWNSFQEASWSHSVRHTTVVRTSLDEFSARCRNLYLTTHSNHNRQTSTHSAGFEHAILACESRQPTP